VERASIFKSNKSQALRLPNPVAYPDTVKQVDIVIQGLAVVTNNTKQFKNLPAIRLANWVNHSIQLFRWTRRSRSPG
jgi:virulence-associated protein VagC